MAERLRRLTRNQIPSGSVGSNPTDCEMFLYLLLLLYDEHILVSQSTINIHERFFFYGHATWTWTCIMDMDMQHGHGHTAQL